MDTFLYFFDTKGDALRFAESFTNFGSVITYVKATGKWAVEIF